MVWAGWACELWRAHVPLVFPKPPGWVFVSKRFLRGNSELLNVCISPFFRDAAGRGLSVTLAEMDDLAQATSSSSTKLFHGGLHYLEYFEFRLVRLSSIERSAYAVALEID